MLAVTAVTTAWNIVAGVGTVVTGALRTAICILTSPVTLVIAAIAAFYIKIGML